MLIKALCDYYDILSEAGKVLPEGYSNVKIHYLVTLNEDGSIAEIVDKQETEYQTMKNGKTKEKKVPRNEVMPERTEKSGIDSNIIEHRSRYLFGLNYVDERLNPDDSTGKAKKSHEAFVKANLEFLEGLESPVIDAYRNFLRNWRPEDETENRAILGLGKKYESAGYMFCLSGEPDKLLHQDTEVKVRWEEVYRKRGKSAGEDTVAQCAISGEQAAISRIHSKIKGVYGGQSTGSVLIGFKEDSGKSYGNDQAYNSNISENAMRKYTEALNYLLSDSRHKMMVDEMTVVFWAMDPSGKCEDLFAAAMNGGTERMDAKETEEMLKKLWKKASEGTIRDTQLQDMEALDENVDFYMVGMKPNSSRLSIKFIERKRYGDILWNIAKFQRDIQVSEKGRLVPLYRIKNELVSPKSTNEKVSPAMFSRFFQSVMDGTAHPAALLETLVRRVKTDKDIDISSVRAGLIKSCINRMKKKEEIKVALDRENHNQAYLCGRLFAVLERLQDRASGGGLNATIKDRYFASASSKPALVFPKLIRLSQTHLGKLGSDGERIYFNKMIGEIIDGIDGRFPDTLLLADQGEFAIGYYQQNQDFFRKKDDVKEEKGI